jgi:HK97 gp10 family phage protein
MSFDYDGVLERTKKKWLKKAALVVKDEAVNRAPVDTGRLAGSLNERVNDDYAEVGTNVEYAPYVEYGTKYMIAQPYLRPALDTNKKSLVKDFDSMLHDEYKEEARRSGNR